MKGKNRVIRYMCFILVVFYICSIISPSLFIIQTYAYQIKTDQSDYNLKQQREDPPYFFSFAFIWGTFEILDYKAPLGFHIHNPEPYCNHTINVKAYYEGRFIFKVASDVYGHFHIGFIGNHYLFVFAFGGVDAFD